MNTQTHLHETSASNAKVPEQPAGHARQGKIARLPADIREGLNRRLLDGETGASLVEWLNQLPPVQAILQSHFGGRPVSEQNLSEWRQGGFHEWMAKTDAARWMADILEDAPAPGSTGAPEGKGAGECMADRVAAWFFPYYVAAARRRLAAAGTIEERWYLLRTICTDLTSLRRNEHYLERLRIWRLKLEAGEGITKEKFLAWARQQEDIEALIRPDGLKP